MLAFFNNFLISQEYVAVQVANEVADEFVSGICTFIAEYVHELSSEWGEQVLCKGKAQVRLELIEEDVAFDNSIAVPN